MRFFPVYLLALAACWASAQSEKAVLSEVESLSSSADFAVEDEGEPLLITGSASADADLLLSDDFDVERYSADFEINLGDTTLGVGYRRTEYDLFFDGPRARATQLDESTDTYSLSVSQKWNDSFSSGLTLGAYEGFNSHRAVWFSEFFRQETGFLPGFRDEEPDGFSFGLTNTYAFANSLDKIALSANYSRDNVFPAQQIGFDPLIGGFLDVGNDVIETVAIGLTGTFYLTNKVTSQWGARASFITDRQPRYQYRANFAWNVFHALTVRSEFGVTLERPEFESYFGGLTVDYQIAPNWSFSLGYRSYGDTGEVTTSNFNSSAPGFDSQEYSASLLWSDDSHAVRLSFAFLEGDFEPVNLESQDFREIFADRDFRAIRLAYTYSF